MAKKPKISISKLDHIVVLDPNWHSLLEGRKTAKISRLESKLNQLLKRQGKVNTEYEEYQKLKKKLLAEIVQSMELVQAGDHEAVSKSSKNQKYVDDINKKLKAYELEKTQLPAKIKEVNKALLEESMFICYEQLMSDKRQKESLDLEIDQMRERLLNKVTERDQLDKTIGHTYSFIHDIAGIEVMEELDAFYFGGKS